MAFNEARIKLKNNKLIRIYYRGKYYHTDYKLPEEVIPPSKAEPNPENNYFDFETGKVKEGYNKKDYQNVNKALQAQKSQIDTLIVEAKNAKLDVYLYIQDYFNQQNSNLKNKVIKDTSTLIDVFKHWSEEKRRKNKNSKEVTTSIIKNIEDFDEEHKELGKTLIMNVDMKFIKEFSKFCVTPRQRTQIVERKHTAPYKTTRTIHISNGTLQRHLIEFVAFLREMNETLKDFKFPIKELKKMGNTLPTKAGKKTQKEDWAYDYLKREEWEDYKALELQLSKKPNEYRQEYYFIYDMYYLCCLIGVRYSDLCTITRSDIENNTLHKDAIKTENKVKRGAFTVPLSSKANEIINKWDNSHGDENKPLFNLPTNQRANITLRKILALIPSLKKTKKIKNFKYGIDNLEVEIKRKCDVLSWHSSRRTFVNLLTKKGVSVTQLQTFTGWSDIRTIISYMALKEIDDEDREMFDNL